MLLSRRCLLAGIAAALMPLPAVAGANEVQVELEVDDPFPLPPFDYTKLPKDFRRAIVPYTGHHRPGTIIVDTSARQLFFVLPEGQAIRYGCAVGRDGFRWAGLADVGRKVMWPRWTPPKEMIARSPEKAKWKDGM